MVIGKTSSSITKGEIFSKVSEAEVLSRCLGVDTLPCVINSPLRKDEHPSFSLFTSSTGHVYFKDYATKESGSLIDLLCRYWGCSFSQTLDKICAEFNNVEVKPRRLKTFTRKEKDKLSEVQVAVRPWRDYDYEYWASYGVGKKWLKYAEIYPISHKIITKKESKEDKGTKMVFPADKYAYCFVERKEGRLQIKIYQPFNDKGYKWCSKMDGSVIGLWTKIPESGDRVIICSSMKDALCVSSQLYIPTLCLQGEGYDMSDTAINELKRRYAKVFISFDTDKYGKEDAEKLAERTGFINVVPDLGKEKDYSDYYKSLTNKEDFKKLEILFN